MNIKLTERPLPPGSPLNQMPNKPRVFEARVEYRDYSVILSRDDIGGNRVPDERWHLSVAGADDVPQWAHLVAIGHKLRPGVCFVVGVPPESWWMNIHPGCLHLWEVKDLHLTDQWRFEAQGHKPT